MRKAIDRLLNNFAAEGNRATAEISFPPDFIGFQGHFPGQPVLPGVCQMELALALADRLAGTRQTLGAVTNAKFISVVLPNQLLKIECSLTEGKLQAAISSEGERISEFKMKVEHA